ncbi:hypothetical protein EXIGLDRAFT_758093 [Exidia glandulosa HHB12029]|uniref:Uncharacterized protein n=1 Tax=Exidia glandulosa HHB12029 TaxID=1314781 RepID=A0A165QL12_EXIGL|nr:hypothetical protein EXIGLDRAFT_758093 [Exidia glandulosa HHB12029]
MYRLQLDLRPGVGAGAFQLGQSLWHVIDVLREDRTSYPKVDVQWDVDSPATSPVILRTAHIDLLFSPLHQRLSMISIHRLRASPPLTLRYKDQIISSWSPAGNDGGDVVLRKKVVGTVFGPTYQGETMRYPGIWFGFEEDGEQGKALKAVVSSSPVAGDDRMLEVRRVVVTQKEERDALDEVAECAPMLGDVARAVIHVREGVTLYLHPRSSDPVHVKLGQTTAQDLTVDVGTPLRVYYKEDDRMSIHAAPKSPSDDASGDYFYNYLQHGMDFLISGKTHIVKKIVLHSNIPGSPMFQRHKRCPWEFGHEDGSSEPGPSFVSKIDEITTFLAPNAREQPPLSMLYDRSEDDAIALPSTTRLMGFEGVVLEVADSEHVLSVTLF